MNVPIVVGGVLVGARTIRESTAPEPAGGWPRLDVLGAGLSVVGLGGLLFGIIEGPSRGWTHPLVLVGLLAGAVLVVLFVRRELEARAPLFDVRILARPAVISGAVTLFMAYMLFNSFLFLNPQYLQDVRGESVTTVGLLFVPFAVVFGTCSLQAARVAARLGARGAIVLGLVACAVATTVFAVALRESLAATIAATVIFGAGLSLLIAPPSTVVMNALPEAKAGDGSSLNFVSRFVGASVGIALLGSVLASLYASDVDPALARLDPTQAAQAEGSIQGAVTVADELDPAAGRALTDAARDAFDRGATVAYLVVTALALLAAAVAWVALGRAEASPDPADPAPSPTPDPG